MFFLLNALSMGGCKFDFSHSFGKIAVIIMLAFVIMTGFVLYVANIMK